MAASIGTPHPNPRWSRSLEPGPRASAECRWFLWGALADRAAPDQVQLAALLATEILSIVVRHGRDLSGGIWVTATLVERGLFVLVREQGLGFSVGQHVGAETDLWGLMLVAKLSSRWGVERLTTGTYIWFELEYPSKATHRKGTDNGGSTLAPFCQRL